MSPQQTRTLEQIGVPRELRERARILWILVALWGAFGWIVCAFVWKVPGQEDDPWFRRQLEQAKFVGIVGWLGYVLCGLGSLVHLALGGLGFLAIHKGEDYSAPVVAGMVDKRLGASVPEGGAGPRAQGPAPEPTTQESVTSLLDPIEGVAYQTWAWAWGHISQGHPIEDIIGRVQLERARWDRVHPLFLQRMAQDTSHTILGEFRKYAGQPAPAVEQRAQQQAEPVQQPAAAAVQRPRPVAQRVGPAGEASPYAPAQPHAPSPPRQPAGPEPAPHERWVEITVALIVGQDKGWDVTQLLSNFGMSEHDWAAVDAWWSQAARARAHDPAFEARQAQLLDYYRSYYSNR